MDEISALGVYSSEASAECSANSDNFETNLEVIDSSFQLSHSSKMLYDYTERGNYIQEDIPLPLPQSILLPFIQ